MNTLQKKSYISLFIIVLLQLIFFYLIYLENSGEERLFSITQSDKVDKKYKDQLVQLSELINNSQIHFNQYVLYREVHDLELYNSDLVNMSSRLETLMNSQNQSVSLSSKLKNNLRLSNSLIQLKYKTDSLIRQKSIFNNQVKLDVLEKPTDYQFEDVLNSVEFETDKKIDSVKKKSFFSRLGSAMKGETEVQKEQINSVLKMKFGKKIISGDIKQQLKNVLIESQKHYNKQFKTLSLGLDNIKKTEKTLIDKNAALVKLYKGINVQLNLLVNDILEENTTKIDEQSRLNKKYRSYLIITVLILILLMVTLLIKYINETFKVKKELAIANHQVTKDLLLKNRIITTLTHEIKTPVSIISLYGAFMRNKNIDPELKDFFDTITYTSNTLQYISSQAVELVKNDKEELTLNLERINLTYQSKKIVNSLSIFASSKNIDLKIYDNINQDYDIDFDLAKFYQLVYNIIGNAIKFARSKVEVTIYLEREEGKTQFVFKVFDDGLGMSKAEVEKVFDFEYQNKKTKAVDTLSFGLGLFLCKKIIELTEGEILLESKEQIGTTVIFKLNQINK